MAVWGYIFVATYTTPAQQDEKVTWAIGKARKTSKSVPSPLGAILVNLSLPLLMTNSIGYWGDEQGRRAYISPLFFHWEFLSFVSHKKIYVT